MGFTGPSDSFTYDIVDQNAGTDQATVTITVFPAPRANEDTYDLYKTGRGAPIVIEDLIANDIAGKAGLTLSFLDYDDSSLSQPLVADAANPDDDDDDNLRYFAPVDQSITTESLTYRAINDEGDIITGIITINLVDPEACDINYDKRKASGLGWCVETYLDSFDEGVDGDGTGTNIALQVFYPHPWHQREHAFENGATLEWDDRGYSPLFIHSHGFGGNKEEDFQNPETYLDNHIAKIMWEGGYNVLSYTQRGFGGIAPTGDTVPSGGSIEILAPNFEGFDFIRVVDWAICHLRVDGALEAEGEATIHDVEADNCGESLGASMLMLDDGTRLTGFDDDVALGTVGYSYGGGYQFLAQSVDARVDAIMPMGTWHDLRYSLHPNDTPKFTWIQIMTQFAGVTPGLGGGNGEPLPSVLIDAQTEMAAINLEADDSPHGKDRQVSVKNANLLAVSGPVAWCNGAQEYYNAKFGDSDGEPVDGVDSAGANTPVHFRGIPRAARANLFMIQGYGDTLFNMNEGIDNAQCFADAGVADVRFLGQTSGHPFPTVAGVIPEGSIPPQYAGSDTGMYLDEVVHCGVDSAGAPVRYNMREVGKQWMDFHLRNGLLPDGMASSDDIFPTVCITQTNVDPNYTLNDGTGGVARDEFYSGTNAAATGFKWSREGVVFDSINDIPLGSMHNTDAATQVLPIPSTAVTTGTASGLVPTITAAPVYTATDPNGEVLAGIPLIHLNVTRAVAILDEIVYAGIYVKRCQLDPDDTTFTAGVPDNCNAGNTEELLHFQVNPIRPFPPGLISFPPVFPPVIPPGDAVFPQADPRNFPGEAKGSYYPVVWGDHPPEMRPLNGDGSITSSLANPTGRLPGVSARLYPGDEVGVGLYAGHYAYLTMSTLGAGSVTVSGSIELPLISAAEPSPPAPPIIGTDANGYIINTP